MIFNSDIHQFAPLPHGPLPDEREMAALAHRRHVQRIQACRKALYAMLHRQDGALDEIDAHLREDVGLAPCGPRPPHFPDDTPPHHEIG